MKLRYTDRSKSDLELAFEWYEVQRRGLGYEFLDCIEVSIRSIQKYPEMYQKSHSQFRRCVIRRFPFSIFYTVESRELIVHSIFDNRQDPQKLP